MEYFFSVFSSEKPARCLYSPISSFSQDVILWMAIYSGLAMCANNSPFVSDCRLVQVPFFGKVQCRHQGNPIEVDCVSFFTLSLSILAGDWLPRRSHSLPKIFLVKAMSYIFSIGLFYGPKNLFGSPVLADIPIKMKSRHLPTAAFAFFGIYINPPLCVSPGLWNELVRQ